MLEHHQALGQALGPGGADVVLAQGLESAGPRQPRRVGDRKQRKRYHGHDQRVVDSESSRWQIEVAAGCLVGEDREHHDHQRADYEVRERGGDRGETHRDVVDPGVLSECRENTEADADRDDQQERKQPDHIELVSMTIKPGEEIIVGQRLRAILRTAHQKRSAA